MDNLPGEIISIIINNVIDDNCHNIVDLCLTCNLWNSIFNNKDWTTYFLSQITNRTLYKNIIVNKRFICTHGKYLYKLDDPYIIKQWLNHNHLSYHPWGKICLIQFGLGGTYEFTLYRSIPDKFIFSIITYGSPPEIMYIDRLYYPDYFISYLVKHKYLSVHEDN